MSGKRYTVPVVYIRFDETLTRDIRKTTDKSAAISEIFNKLISKSQAVYRSSAYLTIDKMLLPFRGHCAFKMYTPRKTQKYGIKVMCLADAIFYTCTTRTFMC